MTAKRIDDRRDGGRTREGNTTSTLSGHPVRWVRDDTFPTTSREDLVDVLATTILTQILADPTCVNRTDTSPWMDADSSLALPSGQSPDAVTERGPRDPANAHKPGRTACRK